MPEGSDVDRSLDRHRPSPDDPDLTIEGFVGNLIPVTIGNMIGGAVMVGIVYWFVYLRRPRSPEAGRPI